jgi:molecular chaperone GrpE
METEQTVPEPLLLPPADWAGELARMRDEIMNEQEKSLRVLADFKNYRRRMERDGQTMADAAKRDVFRSMLEIVDDIEKALRWDESNEAVGTKGLRIILQKMLLLLEANRVVPFESVGLPFDHARHESVAVVQDGHLASGTVTDELRRGYLMNGSLLRASQVRVVE